jgi:hypothetical protein
VNVNLFILSITIIKKKIMEELILFYQRHIDRSISNARKYQSKISNEILEMDGMTGKCTRHFYNNLLDLSDARYLEIGTWMGSSVCSAMYGNKAKVVCVDNWAEFDGQKDDFLRNFEKFKGENDATFIEKDCFKIDVSELPKFNIYLYDGNHTTESHRKALTHFVDCLDDIFIYVVDDWYQYGGLYPAWDGYIFARAGTFDGAVEANLELIDQWQIEPSTFGKSCAEDWWNGCYVAIFKKKTTV